MLQAVGISMTLRTVMGARWTTREISTQGTRFLLKGD